VAGRDEGIWFEVGAEVDKALAALRNVEAELRTFGDTAAKASKAGDGGFLSGLDSGLAKAESAFGKLKSQLSGFDVAFKGMVAGVGALGGALGAVGGSAVALGADFESAMTRVGAVSGATSEEMGQLTEKARQMGRDLPISSREAAEAFGVLASRGYDVKTQLEQVDHVVGLSISQQTDMATSAELLGSTMQSFGLSVQDAGRLTDVFNNACNTSSLTIGDFGVSMKYAAPLAQALGYSVEETVAAMAALKDAGLTAETTGTGLRGVFTALGQAAGESGGKFKEMGIQILDASGKMLPLGQIFQQLKDKSISLADAQKLFGVEAGAAALQLKNSGDALGRYEEGLRKAGTTQENMARYMDTTANRIKNLSSSLDEIRLSIFDQMKEKVDSVLGTLTEMTNAFGAWVKESGVVKASMEGIAEGFGLGEKGVEGFRGALDSIDVSEVQSRFRDFAEGAKALGGALSDLASLVPWRTIIDNLDTIAVVITTGWAAGKIAGIIESILGLTRAFVGLGKGIADTAVFLAGNPMVAALGAIAVAAGLVTKALLEMRDAQDEAVAAARNADDMERWAEDYKLAIEGSEEAIKRLPPHLQKLIEARKEEAKAAQEQTQTMGDYNKALLGNKEALAALPPAAREAAMTVKSAAEASGNAASVAKDYEAAVNGDVAALKRLPEAVQRGLKVFRDQASALKETTKAQQELTKARDADAAAQKQGSGTDPAKAQKAVADAIKATKDAYDQVRERANEAMRDLGVSAQGAAKIVQEDLKKAIDDTADSLAKQFGPEVAQAYKERMAEIGKAAGGAIREATKGLVESVDEFGIKLVSSARGRIEGLTEETRNRVNQLAVSVGTALEDTLKKTGDADEAIVKAFDKFAPHIAALGTGGMQSLRQAFESAPPAVKAALDELIKMVEKAGPEINQAIGAATGNLTSLGLQTTNAISQALAGLKGNAGDVKDEIEKTADAVGRQYFRVSEVEDMLARDRDARKAEALRKYKEWEQTASRESLSEYEKQKAERERVRDQELADADKKFSEELGRYKQAAENTARASAGAMLQQADQTRGGIKVIAGDLGKSLETAGEGLPRGMEAGIGDSLKVVQRGGPQISKAFAEGINARTIGDSISKAFTDGMTSASKTAKEATAKIEASIRDLFEKSKLPEVLTRAFKIPVAPLTTHYDGILKTFVNQSKARGEEAGKAYAKAYKEAMAKEMARGNSSAPSGSTSSGSASDSGSGGTGASSVAGAAAAAGLV